MMDDEYNSGFNNGYNLGYENGREHGYQSGQKAAIEKALEIEIELIKYKMVIAEINRHLSWPLSVSFSISAYDGSVALSNIYKSVQKLEPQLTHVNQEKKEINDDF